ncbi:hypothetical protein OVA29_19510 [Exiguobacterium sp. SL14]|nr:hypothetical protein [Exiguobacterium sp. SL14]MCY1692459.1 hypothetical protein [Exiguobacterium sp. SL14]
MHHIEAINLGTSEPGYFLTVQTDKPTLNEYQVGNSNAFFILQVGLFILFLLLLTRWSAGLFRELERRLERLTVEPPPTDPLPRSKDQKSLSCSPSQSSGSNRNYERYVCAIRNGSSSSYV